MQRALGYQLEQRARDFLAGSSCRRIAIDSYMDGHERQRCELGEARCDVCQQDPRGSKRQAEDAQEGTGDVQEGTANVQEKTAEQTREAYKQAQQRAELERAMALERDRLEMRQRRRMQSVYNLERLEQHLERWSNVCAMCMAIHGEAAHHLWSKCPRATAQRTRDMEAKVSLIQRVAWQPYAYCLYCSVPQSICSLWEEKASEQGAFQRRRHGYCQYSRDMFKHAVAALLAFQGPACTLWLTLQMQEAAIVNGTEEERLRKWLGQKVQIGQRNASQMCCFLYAWEEGRM